MNKITKFLVEGVFAAVLSGLIVLFVEYHFFQNPKETPIAYEAKSASDTQASTANLFKISDNVYFTVQNDGLLKITKKHKSLAGHDYDEEFSKIYINTISKFEIFFSPILLEKSIKIISNSSNGSFSDSFELDDAFSESGFSSYVDRVLYKYNPGIKIVKRERDVQTHLWVLFVGIVIFIIFRINRAINNFFDSGSKFFNSFLK
jgi:hypothetical protein